MIFLGSIGLALELVQPILFDRLLGVSPPTTLWAEPGKWDWPVAINRENLSYAMWRNQDGQMNILELPELGGQVPLIEGASMAGVDFAPIRLPDGRTLEATEQWIVRSSPMPDRPAPGNAAMKKVGLRTEIRAFMDPSATLLGGDIAIKLYDDGEALAGPYTVTRPNGSIQAQYTGPGGMGAFTLDQAGIWSVRFTHSRSRVVRSGTLWFEARSFGEIK